MARKQASRRKAAATKRATTKRAATKRKPNQKRRGSAKKVAKKSPRRATPTRANSRPPGASNDSGDFGIPTDSAVRRVRRGEDLFRTHESHREPRAGAGDVPRDAGVGAPDDGPGSHSGGDVSVDFTGVGTGGSGVAESGAGGSTTGPALSNGNGDFASGPPARGRNNLPPGLVGGSKRVRGSVVAPIDDDPRFLSRPDDLTR